MINNEELTMLREREQELNNILSNSYDGICVVDGKGIIRLMNNAYALISGTKAEYFVGKHASELVKEGYINRSVALEAIKKKTRIDLIQSYPNGKVTMATGTPVLDEQGDVVRIISNIRDVTELHELKRKLEETEKLGLRQMREVEQLRAQIYNDQDIVHASVAMENAIEMARKVAQVNSTVLIHGESGAGKEVFAKLIYRSSNRNKKPFIKINCAAIPENLLESELFGYEAGAFSGAIRGGKEGLIQAAHDGVLFLDEVSELPLNLQPKLLRVLQEREVCKVGGIKPVKVDVRIIAATNQDMSDMVTKGSFRKDLYYRLNVVPIYVPPLRKRKEDIPLLVWHFTKMYTEKYETTKRLSPQVIAELCNYDWPGNVRELQNIIERLMIMSKGDEVSLQDMEYCWIKSNVQEDDAQSLEEQPRCFKAQVAQYEKRILRQALKEYGSIRKAASALQLDPATVSRKLRLN